MVENIGSCPVCDAETELYKEDERLWTTTCSSKYWICDFSISCTDPILLRKLWHHACHEIEEDKMLELWNEVE